ncbi:hypothetical protein [Rhizobium gallicum]|uniref:hypothetical protein n=1 Tax=Rhizobium gallicum TaxID=56730 RepID=UPI001EF78FEF|nr:hypothetical protein [Rhizobium gallicum]ULJ74996.1 hypothetical protein L2W42_32350 [Rhizobium gallicum]
MNARIVVFLFGIAEIRARNTGRTLKFQKFSGRKRHLKIPMHPYDLTRLLLSCNAMQMHARQLLKPLEPIIVATKKPASARPSTKTALMEIVLLKYAELQMASHYFAVNFGQAYSPR